MLRAGGGGDSAGGDGDAAGGRDAIAPRAASYHVACAGMTLRGAGRHRAGAALLPRRLRGDDAAGGGTPSRRGRRSYHVASWAPIFGFCRASLKKAGGL